MNGQLNHSLNVKLICGDFDFLGSRGSGENLHARIVDEILEKKQSAIEVDFNGIEGVAHAFADEVFGLMVTRFGISFLKEHIVLINANDTIKSMFNYAIRERAKKLEGRV
ncbi:STAS-like domain-containing protein [uncultured Helicobacter sp.]|uniref:STAS-like domain-containing protein n=1 Tax=uncultured Helicobacter sp. TaxID=175537 RepID=UPI00261190F0|nr:STAS-like domain-containing protein [uncultured Helicobacter sp.]